MFQLAHNVPGIYIVHMYIHMYFANITNILFAVYALHAASLMYVSCIQLLPYDVDYSSHGITNPKLLKKAVCNMDYPPAISCVITYREELRKTGRPVLVRLDLLGADAGTELTFQCQAYEVDCQQLNGSRNGELKWNVRPQ